jgi:hypothetical protein
MWSAVRIVIKYYWQILSHTLLTTSRFRCATSCRDVLCLNITPFLWSHCTREWTANDIMYHTTLRILTPFYMCMLALHQLPQWLLQVQSKRIQSYMAQYCLPVHQLLWDTVLDWQFGIVLYKLFGRNMICYTQACPLCKSNQQRTLSHRQ